MIEYGLNKYNGTSKNVVVPQGTTRIPSEFFSNLAIESGIKCIRRLSFTKENGYRH